MATGVAPDVHRVGDSTVNFYVLAEGTDLAVVDAGLPAHYEQPHRAAGEHRTLGAGRALRAAHPRPPRPCRPG
jgi:hypothetical protein